MKNTEKEVKILFTGAGRRIELIQAFRQAALRIGCKMWIYGADMAGTAPALKYCDITRKVCAMRQPEYIQQLVTICSEDHIDLVIPTIDTDLQVLADYIADFEEVGTKVLVSKPDKIAICRDKNYTGEFFRTCGLRAPETYHNYLEYSGPYPCFIKPKDGSSSINAYRVNNPEELEAYAGQIEEYVVQPFIDGIEYTIDIFCDFDGNPVYITPRKRVQVRAGEVLKTEIYLNQTMITESMKLIDKFKPCGPITVQLIQDKITGENQYIEINPRYGGGAPLSMRAGARSAEAVLRLLLGEKLSYQDNCCNDGAVYSRFDQSVCISHGNCRQQIKGVIFDLDDTLYSEKQYIRSGYRLIAGFLGRNDAEEKLWKYFLEGRQAIDVYLAEIGAEEKKEDCLKLYRNQMPDITLYPGVRELIGKLKNNSVQVGIITDGRIEGQRNKIKALGLDSLVDDIIITDELGGIQFRKPNDISFRIMQNRWKIPFEQMIYVGDNLGKDFQAPDQLGMRSIYFQNEDGVYFSKINREIRTIRYVDELEITLMKET